MKKGYKSEGGGGKERFLKMIEERKGKGRGKKMRKAKGGRKR
jgi:hypothetical protein